MDGSILVQILTRTAIVMSSEGMRTEAGAQRKRFVAAMTMSLAIVSIDIGGFRDYVRSLACVDGCCRGAEESEDVERRL